MSVAQIAQDTIAETRDIVVQGTRSQTVTVEDINLEDRTVKVSFASEFPVERRNGLEVLEMSETAADLTRLNAGGAVLDGHDVTKQTGRVVRAWIGEDRRAYATLKFSRRPAGEAEFQDVIDGIRTNVSFGYSYRTADTKFVRETRTLHVNKWQGYEISFVAVPADPTVGKGRSQENWEPEIAEQVVKVRVEVETSDPEEKLTENKRGSIDMSKENTGGSDNAAAVTFAREDQIFEYGRRFGIDDNLVKRIAFDPNGTVDTLRAEVAKQYTATENVEVASPSNGGGKQASDLDLTPNNVREYSISRAILAQADGDWSKAGFERECHEEIAKRLGRESGGFFVPLDVQHQRDLSIAGGTATGGALVGTDHLPQSFIEYLRSKAIMLQSGVRVMSGLVGNPSIPRQNGTATGYWVSEGQPPAKSQLALGQLQLSPKTCGARTEFTRQLLIQSAPSIDQLVKADIAEVLARTIDSAIIQGTGTDGQPTGILNTSGVSTVSMAGASFAWVDAVKFESEIAEGNAPEATRWITRPGIRGTLKTRVKETGHPTYLCEGNSMNGYPVEVTTQMPSSTLLFGDFSQVILGEWGVLEIEANKHGSTFAAGGIEVRGLHMVDVGVRHPGALKKLGSFA